MNDNCSNDRTLLYLSDKMISSENLIGVPLLVLANKQDIPECMGVREVKPIFNQSADLIGRRDCMVMPVSALTGYVESFLHIYPFQFLQKIFIIF